MCVCVCVLAQVPCLASPGVEAPFELRLMSAVPLELVPLPELCSAVVEVRGVTHMDTHGDTHTHTHT